MPSSRILCAAILALHTGLVLAAKDPINDPQVIIAGGDGSFRVGSSFSFISPSGTSPISLPGGSPCVVAGISVPDCLFQNASGFDWGTLTFTISPSGQTGPFTCAALAYFAGCSFDPSGTQVTFFGGTGISRGQDFVVEVIGWTAGSSFAGKAHKSQTALEDLPQEPPPRSGTTELFLNSRVAALAWRRLQAENGSGVRTSLD